MSDRIVVLSWFDVYEFDEADTTITCCDCDQQSPLLRNVWQAVQWADRHSRDCPA